MTQPTCGGPAGSAPGAQGNGASAKCSRIYLLPPDSGCTIKLDGTEPSTTAAWLNEQVTRIEVRPKIGVRTYGHDKSCGSQDETPGIFSCDGTIQTRVQCCDKPFSLYAGNLTWIQVWPLGQNNGTPIQGYARITEDPVIMNLENGDPVEHNYSFVSKGQWSFPVGLTGYVDCCTSCICQSGFQAELPAEPEASLLDSDPVTVYKWTDSGTWEVAYSELPEGYTLGPTPDPKAEPGKEAGELKFVKCVKVGPIAAGA